MERKINDFDDSLRSKVRILALKNAVLHGGKASIKAVLGALLKENPELRARVRDVLSEVEIIVDDVNRMSLEEQKEDLVNHGMSLQNLQEAPKDEAKTSLPPLPNARKGSVVMRMAPFPSGPVHIGNARPFILNDEYVKLYGGKLLLVIDDTIGGGGKEIDPEAYELIPSGLRWLGIEFDNVIYKSDRLEIYYEYARKLIELDKAYVCECDVDTLRENRRKGVECEHRKRDVEENLELFERMLSGYFREGQASLRIKTDMKHKNPAFRDRVLMRISERVHPRVGKEYRVWPLLEFSWAIDDHLLGITHIIRGKDLMMETMMEKYIWDIFRWEHPVVIHTGLMKIEGIKLSKSKFQREVRSGVYSGWEDPRTWSLQSLKKRGIQPQAIRNFVLSVGLSQSDITVPIDSLYRENRRLIDPIASRYFFVPNPVLVKIAGCAEQVAEIPMHPDFPEKGKRRISFKGMVYISKSDALRLSKEDIVRLKDLMNIRIIEKAKVMRAEATEQGDLRKIQKIQWVPAEDNITARIVMPDGKLSEGFAETSCLELKANELIQFERFGFCCVDQVDKVNKELVAYYTHR